MTPAAKVMAAEVGSKSTIFMPFMEPHAIKCFQGRLSFGFGLAHVRTATATLLWWAMDAAPFPVVARGARPYDGTPSHVPPLCYVNPYEFP